MTKATGRARTGPALQLKLKDWPAIDQALWHEALEKGDILSGGGGGAKWTLGTRTSVLKGYGRWLAWLLSRELLEPTQAPHARTTPENVASYVAHLRSTQATTTVWHYVHALGMALMVLEPSADIAWLWDVERRLHRIMTPSRRKSDRVVPIRELYDFGFELMEKAAISNELSSLERARRYRNGLMIAFLAARPIRMRNLHCIVIGKHLVRTNRGFYVSFESNETKTHKALEFVLPELLSQQIEIYLATFRPVLIAKRRPMAREPSHTVSQEGLWISKFGTSMTESSIYNAVADLTRKHFGRHVNPHLFRDCAATSIALEDPKHVQITTSILGHATLSTSERYYNHALSIKAASLLQGEVAAIRKEFRKAEQLGRVRVPPS